MGIPTCPSCPTPVPIGVITGPEGASFTCAGCKRQLVWRQGLAAPPTAVIPGRNSATAQLPIAPPPLPPPAPELEIPTDLAVVPVARLPTPPGGVALGVTGEVPIAREHHAFVSAELVAVADEPAPPKSRSSTLRVALALVATLALGVGAGWFLFGREKPPAPAPAPAETPMAAAPEVEAAPRPTRPPETSAALAAALELPPFERPEPRERPAPKKLPTRRAVQAPRTSRPGAQPPPERTLNKKPVVLEYDDGTASGDIAPEWQAAVETARAHYQRGNKKLFAKDSAGAIGDYIAAIDAYGGYAAAYRGLGLALAEQHDDAKAVTAFRTYLRSAPTAKDAALIKKVVEKLEHGE